MPTRRATITASRDTTGATVTAFRAARRSPTAGRVFRGGYVHGDAHRHRPWREYRERLPWC